MVGFITKPEQFELLPGVAKAIKAINKSGYLAIVITNQPVIARGDCTFEQLQTIHNKMETELGKEELLLMPFMFALIIQIKDFLASSMNISVTAIAGSPNRVCCFKQQKISISICRSRI